jgi:hypothetical protein
MTFGHLFDAVFLHQVKAEVEFRPVVDPPASVAWG